MQKVKSSNVDSYHYNAAEKKLHVVYKNGGAYVYDNVPHKVGHDIDKAKSVGTYLAQHVKDKFTFKRL